MYFFEHQARARRKTGLLVAYFIAAVVLIILSVYLAVASVFFFQGGGTADSAGSLWHPDVLAVVGLTTVAIVALGTVYKVFELAGGGEVVARTLGGRPVNPNTRDLAERVLLNVVEEMALASGTPVPPVYIMDREAAINAFAAGTSPQNAVIGVTRGTIENLSRDELQGVIAHEFSHILNGDMRLNIHLIAVLNGILLISTIGYILLRTGGRAYFSNNKRGGNPLPLLGLLLYIIGYVGVFFGHLIKSAVSRQREYLADASAVQFTRYPDGIAGALKKIGGLAAGSRLRTERAEEASHMYFGNGLRAPLLSLLATHPPLDERIRRVDPRFDGVYPRVRPVQHTVNDLVDPRSMAVHPASAAETHRAAVAGAASLVQQPTAAVEHVGQLDQPHMDYAHALVETLPPRIADAVHDPLGAVAVVYALLLSRDDAEVRSRQLDYLASTGDRPSHEETRRLAPLVDGLKAEMRLPLVAMALPALEALSVRQREAFAERAMKLIKADQRISLFEYAVHRLILTRLVERLAQRRARPASSAAPTDRAGALSGLLSTLAQWGTRNEAQARQAFDLAARLLPSQGHGVILWPRDRCGIAALDAALDHLAHVSPAEKKQILKACATCIAADGRVTVEEGEILRVVADALDCPMPPLADVRTIS